MAAGLADIAQSKCQRRRNARADNQGGQNTHDEDGNDFTAGEFVALVLEIGLDGVGQLDIEEAEHGHSQYHHQRCGGKYDPRLLQPYGQQRAGQTSNHADQGIGQCQALYIHHRQGERAAFAGFFIAYDNAGNNRQERIHTGGKA